MSRISCSIGCFHYLDRYNCNNGLQSDLDTMVRYVFEYYLNRNKLLNDLPEMTEIILSIIPKNISQRVKNELLRLVNIHGLENINPEGFSLFRSHLFKEDLDIVIAESMKHYFVRQRYFDFLDTMKHYVDTTPFLVDEIYVSEEAVRREETGCMLELLLELLPQKIIIYGIKSLSNVQFIDSVQYIFGSRVIMHQ